MRAFLSQPDILRLGEVPFALAKTDVCNQSVLPSPRRRCALPKKTQGLLTFLVFIFASAKLSFCLSEAVHLDEGGLRLGEPKASCQVMLFSFFFALSFACLSLIPAKLTNVRD